ncbi:hypothetical protein EDB83DRAFT_2474288 [Lactarius deliciosus]|nr:hypothetical protein EDB83DRAFT_2474288 [Lactarius deliciosus]
MPVLLTQFLHPLALEETFFRCGCTSFAPPACASIFFDLAIPLLLCGTNVYFFLHLILHDSVADHMRSILSETASRCSY